ncbi:MAG: hypothetical protein JRJ87_12755 [Deltaproteobacteria bacterium]|nr:hypothetical protein [Deltaproteobacteria bacterium]
MNRLLSTTLTCTFVILGALIFQACGETQCGLGTTKEGDRCVPLCKAGEYWDATETTCRPVIGCAEGTSLNPLTGECEPDITECADGTELVNGECVPECIDGEEFWNGAACQPIPDCAQGTSFNENTNECEPIIDDCATGTHLEGDVCVPDVICGPGTHAEGGECVADTLGEPDIVEGEENNDIFFPGWTATLVNLPAEGDNVTLGGTISMPTDLDGDNVPDADWDAFILVPDGEESLAGTYLHIEATSESACLPAIWILGIDEESWNITYQRYALNRHGAVASRDVYLPDNGLYFILITDYNNLVNDIFGLGGFPVGGDDFTYFVTLEHRAVPTATDISGFPYSNIGTFNDGSLQFFSLPSLLADDILLAHTAAQPNVGISNEVMPIAMLFGPDGTLVKEITNTATGEDLDLLYLAQSAGDYVLVLDYLLILGPNRQYALDIGLRAVDDLTGQSSPVDGELPADEDDLLMWDLTEGDFFMFEVSPPAESTADLALDLLNGQLDLLGVVDSGTGGISESAFHYFDQAGKLFMQISEADGVETGYSVDFTILPTPLLESGNSYTDLEVFDMPTYGFPDAAIEHFEATAGQMVFFTNFSTSGSWWATPNEQIYSTFIDFMGPIVDATDSNFPSLSPLMAFIPADGHYFHLVWDSDAVDSPAGATYDTDFYAQDSTVVGAISSGSTTLEQQVLDTNTGTAVFFFAASTGQAMDITVTPAGPDFQPEVWVLTFGSVEGDGFFTPYYWASDPESLQLGRVALATAESAGESTQTKFLSRYDYVSVILVRDVGSSQSPGTFELDISVPSPPANDTCQTASPIVLDQGSASIEGSNWGATNTVGQDVLCTDPQYPPIGPDVFYSIDLAEGEMINVELDTPAGTWFDNAVYLVDNCDCPACGCMAGADTVIEPADPEQFSYTVPTGAGGTYYIIVDSWSLAAVGDFILNVDVN